MTYNVWNKWDKLETVMLGSCYPMEFYDEIKEDKIRDPLLRITEESLEDLDYFDKVLKDFGCEVLRAPASYKHIEKWIEKKCLPRSSLQPRDYQVVVGNKCAIGKIDNYGIIDTLRDYNSKDCITDPQAIMSHVSKPSPDHIPWGAPSCTVVGSRIYLDTKEFNPANIKWFKKHFPETEFEYVEVSIGGHNDACFTTLKPGVIMSLYDIQKYDETFPGWDVCYLPDNSWDQVEGWSKMKQGTRGKWWLPGEENNEELIHFVNTWLDDWLGYVEETVFDVNCLVLDEHHVCVSNPNNEQVNAFLKKHKMEPVHIPWRHRYFWDGGLHCITLDLKRKGTKQNYF